MSERGRSRSPKRLTPSPHRNGDVAMSPRAPSAGGSASGSRVIVIDGLTKNVHPGHLREIFGFYGKVTGLDLPVFKVSGLNRGKAALEFDRPNQAEEAVRCMDGGILDGSVLKVQVSADPLPPPRQPSPVARRSPPPPRRGSFRSRSPSPRRGGGWRRSPPPHRRRSPSPYGRSPSPRRGGGFDRRPPPAYGPSARNIFGGRGGDSYGGGRGGNSYGGGRGGNSFSGGRGGGRDFRGGGGDVYRPRSRSRTRSPPYRRPPPRRSPDYVRGARSRSRSPRRSYSRSLSPRRSRSRSYSRSRSRSFSPRRSYSRSISPRRDRSASMRSRSRSRTRSRSPRSASPRR